MNRGLRENMTFYLSNAFLFANYKCINMIVTLTRWKTLSLLKKMQRDQHNTADVCNGFSQRCVKLTRQYNTDVWRVVQTHCSSKSILGRNDGQSIRDLLKLQAVSLTISLLYFTLHSSWNRHWEVVNEWTPLESNVLVQIWRCRVYGF